MKDLVSNDSSHTTIVQSSMDSSMSDMRHILQKVQQYPQRSSGTMDMNLTTSGSTNHTSGGTNNSNYDPIIPDDEEDFCVLRFGNSCIIQSRQVQLITLAIHFTVNRLLVILFLQYFTLIGSILICCAYYF
jgi:hypothetical protein